MAFQVSPGINVSEIDLTASIPSVSVSTGAIAGAFKWGPALEIVRVSSETELVNRFGAPDNETANVFFTAASFLAYSNDLLVVRGVNASTSNNATGSSNVVSIVTLTGTANVSGTAALAGTVDAGGELTLGGTANIASGSAIVVGNGTSFTSSLAAGDQIKIGGNTRTVTVVANSTSLTVNSAFTQTLTTESANAIYNASVVLGTTTAFDTEFLEIGDQVKVTNNVRTITNIQSSSILRVNSAFDAGISGQTIDAVYGKTVILGTSTAFNTDFDVGDYVRIGTENREIASISSDTFLRVDSAFTSGLTGQVVKGFNTTAPTPSRILVENSSEYVNSPEYQEGSTANASFVARYHGNKGNSLLVSICPSDAAFTTWGGAAQYDKLFDSAPGTSDYVSGKGGTNDELHIVVVDAGGLFTGTPGTVLERFGYLSKAADARTDDGSTNYYKEVLFNKSKYVYFAGHPGNDLTVPSSLHYTDSTNWGENALNTAFGASGVVTVRLGNGNDGSVGQSQLETAYDLYEDKENIDLSLLIAADGHDKGIAGHLIDLAESRKDCVAFISPTYEDITETDPATSISGTATALSTRNSYGVHDSGWKYMYDKYNDRYRWVPLNGDIAGLCARTDRERDPWFSPAGFARGSIKNVVKLAFNPNQTQRDTLYKAGVNPVVSLPGEGTVLFGDKTLSIKPSAFDRINVRRLFIVLEKAISRAARASLFEFNDEFTRAQFVSLVEPFLRTVQGRRGIYDFRVVCDETNNTADIIDRNEFVGDIYIKPARSINFVQLNFVAVRTGVEFNEIVGKF